MGISGLKISSILDFKFSCILTWLSIATSLSCTFFGNLKCLMRNLKVPESMGAAIWKPMMMLPSLTVKIGLKQSLKSWPPTFFDAIYKASSSLVAFSSALFSFPNVNSKYSGRHYSGLKSLF